MSDTPDNLAIYDANWTSWLDMKRLGPASRWLRALVRDAASKLQHPPATVHDVGCGVGTNTAFLTELFPNAQVRGSDFSSTAIAVASAHNAGSGAIFVHDPENRALDEPAELVCCFEVLEHVDDWNDFLSRLATPGCRYLLLSFPTGRMRPFEVNIGHLRNFRRGEVEQALGSLGFRPRSIAYAGFPFYSPLYRDACQLTNAGDAEFTKGSYGPGRRVIAWVTYVLFRYFSTQRRGGDQFVGLFERTAP